MNAILTYILEVNMYILLFGLAYSIFFRNETYHRVNRAVILGSIVTAFLIPLLNFSGPQVAISQIVNLDPVLISAQSNISHSAEGYNFPSFLSVIYWTGFGVSCYYILRRIHALLAIGGELIKPVEHGIRIVKTRALKSPASFFNTIYLTEDLLPDSEQTVLEHEFIHIREKHSLDLIFMQMVQAVCWFNPMVYRLITLLEATHEFRADELACAKEINKTSYSKLLISQALNVNPTMLAHQFSKTNHLKRRIMMLHKSRTPSTSILKYFLLIPIISGALFLNACTQENPEENPSDISGTSQKAATENGTSSADQAEGTDIYTVAEVMPAYPGGNDAMINFLGENIEYPAGCKKEGVEGTVFVSFVVDESGNPTQIKVLRSPDDRLSANAMEVVGKMPTWSPGENGGKPVKVQYSLPIKYKLN